MKSFNAFNENWDGINRFPKTIDEAKAVVNMTKIKDKIGKIARTGPLGGVLLKMVSMFLRRKITGDQFIKALVAMGASPQKLSKIKEIERKMQRLPAPKKEGMELDEAYGGVVIPDPMTLGQKITMFLGIAVMSAPLWGMVTIQLLDVIFGIINDIKGKRGGSGLDFGNPNAFLPDIPAFQFINKF